MSISRMLVVAAGILLAGVVLLFMVHGRGGTRPKEPSAPSQAAPDQSPPVTEDTLSWEGFVWTDSQAESLPRSIAEADPTLVDPFTRAYARKKVDRVALRLEGLAPGDEPLALISGQVVRVGASVEGFRVTRIDTSGVSLLSSTGKRLDLSLAR